MYENVDGHVGAVVTEQPHVHAFGGAVAPVTKVPGVKFIGHVPPVVTRLHPWGSDATHAPGCVEHGTGGPASQPVSSTPVSKGCTSLLGPSLVD